MKTYVVLASHGEYSDCTFWVAGVYRSLEEAQAQIETRTQTRLKWEEWARRYQRAYRRGKLEKKPISTFTDADLALMTEIGGIEPEREYADRLQVEERTLGKWNQGEVGEKSRAEQIAGTGYPNPYRE